MRGGNSSKLKRTTSVIAIVMAGAAIGFYSLVLPADAQTSTSVVVTPKLVAVNIPAQSLSSALITFSRQTKVEIFIKSSLAEHKTSMAVHGSLTPEIALQQLLGGTGLVYSFTNANTVRILANEATSGAHGGDATDGSVLLETITVSSGGDINPVEAPYYTPAAVSYISGQSIERFDGTSPADIFRGTPGVMSGEARNGSSIDVNIRGMQGMGRVPVTVDGSISSATVYQGYQGVSNRTYIDPDLIGGVAIQKGPSSSAYGGIAGAVSMETLSASSILLDGKDYGIR